MAVPSFTRTADLPGGAQMHTWSLTTADHTGEAMEVPGASDRTVTVTNANWGAATLILEGSNNGTTYLPMTDNGNTAISFTTDGIEVILQNPRYIRPRLSVAGTASVPIVQILSRTTR